MENIDWSRPVSTVCSARFCRKKQTVDKFIGRRSANNRLLADGKVEQSEAEFLYTWLIQSRQTTDNPVIINLLNRVDAMLKDGFLDQEESAELLSLLHKLTGAPSEVGELAKTSSLPVDEPAPTVSFHGNQFLFTGTCVYGARKDCQAVIEQLGGITNAVTNQQTLSLSLSVRGKAAVRRCSGPYIKHRQRSPRTLRGKPFGSSGAGHPLRSARLT